MNYSSWEKKNPQPEDRAITSLEIVRMKIVDALCRIDKELKYLDRVKDVNKKKRNR